MAGIAQSLVGVTAPISMSWCAQGFVCVLRVDESEKGGLKLNIQEMNITASGLITSWQTDGERMETVQHSFGSVGHSNQGRKISKKNPHRKRRSETLTVCR